MAHRFVLITDSTVDENAGYYAENDIPYAPLSLTVDGRTLEEDCGQTLSFHDFYDLLRQGKQASTAQAKMDCFLRLFEQALAAGQDVLYVGFSSGLSGTYQAGCMAAAELAPRYPDRKILCVDSLAATGGEYLLVDKAREMRDQGCTAEETAAEIERLRLQVVHLFTVDDLNHLYRGGRLSRASAIVGSLLGIKPLLYMDDAGKLCVHGKLRGRQNVIRWLAERALCGITDRNTPVRISHGDCLEDAQLLADLLAKGGVQADIRYVGTVIGSHTGPAVLAIFFFGEQRKPE